MYVSELKGIELCSKNIVCPVCLTDSDGLSYNYLAIPLAIFF